MQKSIKSSTRQGTQRTLFKQLQLPSSSRQSLKQYNFQLILKQQYKSIQVHCSSEEEASAQKAGSSEDSKKTVAVFGATGYIGKKVVEALCNRGYNVIACARPKSGIGGQQSMDDTRALFPKAQVAFGDVTSVDNITSNVFNQNIDAVMCCLASRTGGIQDSWDIDYQATLNTLQAARQNNVDQFVLLSAICVQKPLLTFQKAKLKFEEELMNAGDIKYSIVRPTAFFKSLAGQVEVVKSGGPYVMFGDGNLASCKPISEEDLADYMVDCLEKPELQNKVLPIGGPGEALSAKQQGDMIFRITGKKPFFIRAPVILFDLINGFLDFLASKFPSLVDTAEFGKIGKYYATESMLVWDEKNQKYLADATPSYGSTTLEQFFTRVAEEGLAGQELGDQAIFKKK